MQLEELLASGRLANLAKHLTCWIGTEFQKLRPRQTVSDLFERYAAMTGATEMFFYTAVKRVVPQKYIVTLHTSNFYYWKFASHLEMPLVFLKRLPLLIFICALILFPGLFF